MSEWEYNYELTTASRLLLCAIFRSFMRYHADRINLILERGRGGNYADVQLWLPWFKYISLLSRRAVYIYYYESNFTHTVLSRRQRMINNMTLAFVTWSQIAVDELSIYMKYLQ